MAKPKYQVVGRVVRSGSQQGVPDVRVEAWDKDLLVDDMVGSAVTGADGGFRMEFDTNYFLELFLDRKPDLYFKVFREDVLIKSTEDSVLWNIEAGKTEITIEVNAADGPKGELYMPDKPKGPKDGPKKGPKKGSKDGPKKGPKDGLKYEPKKGPKKGPKDGPKKGPKDGPKKGDKNGKKDKGKSKYPPDNVSDFLCVIISRKCAIELLTALSLALGSPPPKKKDKSKKKGKKGKGDKGDKGYKGYKGDKGDKGEKGGKGGKGEGGKGGGKLGGGVKTGGGPKSGGSKSGSKSGSKPKKK